MSALAEPPTTDTKPRSSSSSKSSPTTLAPHPKPNSNDNNNGEALSDSTSSLSTASTLLYIGLNQDHTCFSTGVSNGFRIYNCEPFRETFRRTFTRGGGIGHVEMLFRCNLLALVGGGSNPRYPQNKVMIWDDHQNRCIGELSFRQKVLTVKLRRDRVVCALLSRVYVYRFSDLALLDQFNSINNPRGLLALSPEGNSTVLACPSITKGHVRVELYDARKSTLIPAHETDLAAIALNQAGTRLATASEKGTLIRVFDTHTGQMMKELRRGTERAGIEFIAFNSDSSFLACSSDKGTVHIFNLNNQSPPAANSSNNNTVLVSRPQETTTSSSSSSNNKKSPLNLFNKFLPQTLGKYFESEWSYAQIHNLESTSICAFGIDPFTILVIGQDGSFLKANFEGGGEAKRVSFNRFLERVEDRLDVGEDGGRKSDEKDKENGDGFVNVNNQSNPS